MTRIERELDRLHAAARRIPALHRLAIISRISLVLALLVLAAGIRDGLVAPGEAAT